MYLATIFNLTIYKVKRPKFPISKKVLTAFSAIRMACKAGYEAFKNGYSPKLSSGRLSLTDYKGNPAIELDEDSIYYMEAQDNYVRICYLSDGELQKFMLRCPTQKLESMLDGTSLIRCHRSFIVNLDHVHEIVRGHKCATLVLDDAEGKEIAVSKSYYKRTLEHLQGRVSVKRT